MLLGPVASTFSWSKRITTQAEVFSIYTFENWKV